MANLIHRTKASAIPYAIRGERTEHFTAGRSEFSCILVCLYEQRFAFVLDVLGYVNTDGSGADKFTRVLPEFYQGVPDAPCVALQLVGIDGVVNALPPPEPIPVEPPEEPELTFSEGVTYLSASGGPALAIFRAIFATVDYPIREDDEILDGEEWKRFTLLEEQYASEAQQYPGGSWYLPDVVGVGRTIQEAISLPYFTRDLVVHWLAIPHFSRENIENCLNKVNDAEILFTRGTVHYKYAPETLLFKGWTYKMERSAAGQFLWHIQFNFSWNPSTWNKVFRAYGPNGPGYYTILSTDGDLPPYESTGLLKIFSIIDPLPPEPPP